VRRMLSLVGVIAHGRSAWPTGRTGAMRCRDHLAVSGHPTFRSSLGGPRHLDDARRPGLDRPLGRRDRSRARPATGKVPAKSACCEIPSSTSLVVRVTPSRSHRLGPGTGLIKPFPPRCLASSPARGHPGDRSWGPVD
jgi:hypothetical protein